jgi:hypothetical protein
MRGDTSHDACGCLSDDPEEAAAKRATASGFAGSVLGAAGGPAGATAGYVAGYTAASVSQAMRDDETTDPVDIETANGDDHADEGHGHDEEDGHDGDES